MFSDYSAIWLCHTHTHTQNLIDVDRINSGIYYGFFSIHWIFPVNPAVSERASVSLNSFNLIG